MCLDLCFFTLLETNRALKLLTAKNIFDGDSRDLDENTIDVFEKRLGDSLFTNGKLITGVFEIARVMFLPHGSIFRLGFSFQLLQNIMRISMRSSGCGFKGLSIDDITRRKKKATYCKKVLIVSLIIKDWVLNFVVGEQDIESL